LEEVKRKKNFYYSTFESTLENKTLIRAEKKNQLIFALSFLNKLKKIGFPIRAKRIIIGKLPMWEGECFGYSKGDEIFISARKNISESSCPVKRKKKNLRLFLTLTHELIHVLDYKTKDFATSFFYSNYNECILNFKNHIEENDKKVFDIIFNQPMNKTFLMKHGMKKWYYDSKLQRSLKKKYEDFIKYALGVPSLYSLTAPCEFSAELISSYIVNKKSVHKKFHKKIKNLLREIK
jgi:hypothetical protein